MSPARGVVAAVVLSLALHAAAVAALRALGLGPLSPPPPSSAPLIVDLIEPVVVRSGPESGDLGPRAVDDDARRRPRGRAADRRVAALAASPDLGAAKTWPPPTTALPGLSRLPSVGSVPILPDTPAPPASPPVPTEPSAAAPPVTSIVSPLAGWAALRDPTATGRFQAPPSAWTSGPPAGLAASGAPPPGQGPGGGDQRGAGEANVRPGGAADSRPIPSGSRGGGEAGSWVGAETGGRQGVKDPGGTGGGGGAGGPALTSAAGGQATVPPEYDSYVRVLRQRIQDRLVYPGLAVRQRLHGVVELEVRIDSRGRLADVRVVGGEGVWVLREAALRAVRDATPLDFPVEVTPRPLTITLPIVFELR